MVEFPKRKIILMLILSGVLFLLLYLISLIPRKINISYNGIMYSNDAYMEKDYNNLGIRNTKVYMKGKLYKAWFRQPYFIGYIDTDIAPVNDTLLRPAYVFDFESIPWNVHYDYYNRRNLKIEEYADTYIYKDMSQIYLEFKEYSGYKGYSALAPARDLKDIDKVRKDIRYHTVVLPTKNLVEYGNDY